MGWHILNIEVILQKRISFAPCSICSLESFGKSSWVLIVKESVDSVESTLLFGVLPISFISLWSEKISLNLEFSPEAEAIFISPKTLSSDLNLLWFKWNGFWLNRLSLLSFLGNLLRFLDSDPISWGSGIELLVVICFQRQPSTNSFGWVSEFNFLYLRVN